MVLYLAFSFVCILWSIHSNLVEFCCQKWIKWAIFTWNRYDDRLAYLIQKIFIYITVSHGCECLYDTSSRSARRLSNGGGGLPSNWTGGSIHNMSMFTNGVGCCLWEVYSENLWKRNGAEMLICTAFCKFWSQCMSKSCPKRNSLLRGGTTSSSPSLWMQICQVTDSIVCKYQ